uniref:Uncharacterized protein n=1 Tax=Piliocolobus tephrosceles TaxID=591936 RepID=A0A8C9LTU8_9PRIM
MPGQMKGKAGEWGAGGALKAQRRPTAKVSGLSRKGPSARIPPARPPVHPPGRGSRRTCPFHCGSLCPAWRRSWIAGFLFIPDWAPFDSLYHPVPGGPYPPSRSLPRQHPHARPQSSGLPETS